MLTCVTMRRRGSGELSSVVANSSDCSVKRILLWSGENPSSIRSVMICVEDDVERHFSSVTSAAFRICPLCCCCNVQHVVSEATPSSRESSQPQERFVLLLLVAASERLSILNAKVKPANPCATSEACACRVVEALLASIIRFSAGTPLGRASAAIRSSSTTRCLQKCYRHDADTGWSFFLF